GECAARRAAPTADLPRISLVHHRYGGDGADTGLPIRVLHDRRPSTGSSRSCLPATPRLMPSAITFAASRYAVIRSAPTTGLSSHDRTTPVWFRHPRRPRRPTTRPGDRCARGAHL